MAKDHILIKKSALKVGIFLIIISIIVVYGLYTIHNFYFVACATSYCGQIEIDIYYNCDDVPIIYSDDYDVYIKLGDKTFIDPCDVHCDLESSDIPIDEIYNIVAAKAVDDINKLTLDDDIVKYGIKDSLIQRIRDQVIVNQDGKAVIHDIR